MNANQGKTSLVICERCVSKDIHRPESGSHWNYMICCSLQFMLSKDVSCTNHSILNQFIN